MNISSTPAISGIQSTLLRQDISAHDVANLNSPGFEQSTPYQTDVIPTGTQISHLKTTPNDNPSLSNTDLATETVEMKNNIATFRANSTVMKVQDRMIGSLLDIFA